MKKLFVACCLTLLLILASAGGFAEDTILEVPGIGAVHFLDQCPKHPEGTISCPEAACMVAGRLIPDYKGKLTEGSTWHIVCTSTEEIEGKICYGFSVGEGNDYEFVELMSAAISPTGSVYLWDDAVCTFRAVDTGVSVTPAPVKSSNPVYRIHVPLELDGMIEEYSETSAAGTTIVRRLNDGGSLITAQADQLPRGSVGDGYMTTCAVQTTAADGISGLTWSADERCSAALGWPAYILRWENRQGENIYSCTALLAETSDSVHMFCVSVRSDCADDYTDRIEAAFAGASLVPEG